MVRFRLDRQVSTPEYTLGVLTEPNTGFKCKTLEKAVYKGEGALNPMFYAVTKGEYRMKIVDIGHRFTFGIRLHGTYRNARLEGKPTQNDIFPGSVAVGRRFVERKGLEGGEEVQNVIADLIDHLLTEIAADKVIKRPLQVIDIIRHFAAGFHSIAVLIKSPCEHTGRVCHRQIELDMVTCIIPAAVYIVNR